MMRLFALRGDSMIEYTENGNVATVDGYRFVKDKRTGYYLSSRAIGSRRKRLHVYMWERENGAIPRGFSIHHKDMNKGNNEIGNLAMMDTAEHISYHGKHLTEEERKRRSENIVKKGVPAAKAWHRSKEGYEWHVQQGKNIFGNLSPVEYECTYCKKKFISKHHYGKNSNTFCCNNCKSAYRRMIGVDDIIKVCEECGNEYKANKYQKTKYCKSCRDKRRRRGTCV